MSKAVSVSDGLYDRIVRYCESKQCSVEVWIESVLKLAMDAHVTPVEKRPKPQLQGGDTSDNPDIWQRPPFWAGRPKNKLEAEGPSSRAEGRKAGEVGIGIRSRPGWISQAPGGSKAPSS